MNQKLSDWASIAEVLGAVAIVVSLVVVGVELRQSNALATTDSLKDGTQLWTDAYVSAWGTEESTAFFRKAVNHCEDLSKDERGRFFTTLFKFVAAYDNIFNQYESGRLREEVFVSIAAIYYPIANTACAQSAFSQDIAIMPPWLVSLPNIESLSPLVGNLRLPTFLIE